MWSLRRQGISVKWAAHNPAAGDGPAGGQVPCPRLVCDPSGPVAYADGRPIRPEYLTHRFREIRKDLGLPPIRLHNLPHGAAPSRWPPTPT